MVKFFASSSISSSITAVAIGSSAEHGSSIKITSGLTAIALAIQRRCCCPPDNDVPGSSNLSFTSLYKPAFFKLYLTKSFNSSLLFTIP